MTVDGTKKQCKRLHKKLQLTFAFLQVQLMHGVFMDLVQKGPFFCFVPILWASLCIPLMSLALNDPTVL